MKIGFVAAESFPFVKIGGLADVSGSLFKIFSKKYNAYLFLPFYKTIYERYKTEKIGEIEVYFNEERKEKCEIYKISEFKNVILSGNEKYFFREEIYGPDGKDYPDNLERFSFFSKSVCEICKFLNIEVDIFHFHDWHTALLPLYLNLYYRDFFKKTKSLFTIHNIAYQGIFPPEKFSLLGLPNEYFSMEELEFYGNINIMKAGIIHSDRITTVSEKFSEEILTEEFGFKLDGLLRKYKDKIIGILNGIDYQVWNPAFDNLIYKKYRSAKGKILNKLYLQEKIDFKKDEKIPLFGMVSRIVEQKGIDYLIDIFDEFLKKDVQLLILGKGEKRYEEILDDYAKKYKEKFKFTCSFDEKLAHQIYAGSDFFLMPSKFEPCGLGQLISLKYGTVPIVRKIGGLADSVKDINENGYGFVFFDKDEFLLSIERAIEFYKNRNLWEKIVLKCMKLDFSWKNSSEKYEKIYQEILKNG